jgi:hypothetical protein
MGNIKYAYKQAICLLTNILKFISVARHCNFLMH